MTLPDPQQDKRIAGYLGLAQKARMIAAGDGAAKDALIHGKAAMLVLAGDAAQSVAEELSALAEACEVPVIRWADKASLGLAVGKSPRGAAVLLDEGFAKAIDRVLQGDNTPKAKRGKK